MEKLTVEKAKTLKVGAILCMNNFFNADGSNKRWRVNGKIKTWKRSPEKISIPVKHGMFDFGYITEKNINEFHIQ